MRYTKSDYNRRSVSMDNNQMFNNVPNNIQNNSEDLEKEKFKNSKWSKFLLIFFAVSMIFFFLGEGLLLKIMIGAQAILLLGAWLCGMKIVKEPFNGAKIIMTIAALVLVIPIINTGGSTKKDSDDDLDSNDNYSDESNSNYNDDYDYDYDSNSNYSYDIDSNSNDTSKEEEKRLAEEKAKAKAEEEAKKKAEAEAEAKAKAEAEAKKKAEEAAKKAASNVIGTKFKAAMDSYEKFMDEYIAFMKKYQKNPTDVQLIQSYSKYMEKYADVVEKFEAWDDEDLNDAELAYYIQVQNRVAKKLASIQ